MNGNAVMSEPSGSRTSPVWSTYPGAAFSPKSSRNIFTLDAMAGRGVDESLTSMGTSRLPNSTTISTSAPADVLQKNIPGSIPRCVSVLNISETAAVSKIAPESYKVTECPHVGKIDFRRLHKPLSHICKVRAHHYHLISSL